MLIKNGNNYIIISVFLNDNDDKNSKNKIDNHYYHFCYCIDYRH